MAEFWIELSRENTALAEAECAAVVEATGGSPSLAARPPTGFWAAAYAQAPAAREAAQRLASARRVLEIWPWTDPAELIGRFRVAGRATSSAAFRQIRARGSTPIPSILPALASAYVEGGGSIDLESPLRRFWLTSSDSGWIVGEEVDGVDRRSFNARRMPQLPFQRPVSLPPRLGRIAVNLARLRPGLRVVDPFAGTGALLAEAALLGARVTGIDRDASMIRGAIRNFAHLGLSAEQWSVDDAGSAAESVPTGSFDAVISDPPYGRASSAGKETPAALLARVLPKWGDAVTPGGRIVLVVADASEPLGAPWHREVSIVDRVHRSLTREFRVYRRRP